jgi:glycosyltransferase involved in cell wall biosynthesis
VSQTVWQLYRKAIVSAADIYHFHDPELIPVGLLLRARGKTVIYDVHEYYKKKILCKSYIPHFLRRPLSSCFDSLETIASKFFSGIVVADRATQAKFHGKAILVENFPYVPEQCNVAKRSNSCFTLVYLGAISEERGLLAMVRALEFIDDPIRLTLIGEFASNDDKKKAESMDGYAKVDWLGHKNWPDALSIMASADLGLALFQPVPALFYAGENTLKIFEYMLFGLPVMASDFPNLRTIVVGNACGVVVDPTDPKRIADEIIALMKSRDRCVEMGQRGAKAVVEKYNWAHCSKALLNLYDEVLS